MAQYIVLHTLKKSTEGFNAFFKGVAPEFARKTVSGETPGNSRVMLPAVMAPARR